MANTWYNARAYWDENRCIATVSYVISFQTFMRIHKTDCTHCYLRNVNFCIKNELKFSSALDEKKPCKPALHYSFANITRNVIVNDDSGNENNGIIQDDVSLLGNIGYCVSGAQFKDGVIRIDGAKFKPKPRTAVTIATWVKLERIGPNHELFVTVDPGWTNPRWKTIYNLEINYDGSIQFTHRYTHCPSYCYLLLTF